MKNFLCKIGLHKWKQNRPLCIRDIHPVFDYTWKTPTRTCLRCGKQQQWLPGYGGSELGCWTKIKS
jgi:hypothetical protein